jgi:hypothetical protein
LGGYVIGWQKSESEEKANMTFELRVIVVQIRKTQRRYLEQKK